ncbi:hypothetical protein RHGRI_021867 [Rhododendron griersonianum]|uniref:Uncharacterized protein n=1 Tax=Rhododendron griersonianum TaxID=479676 RepID=A0AAV6JQP1_9ERIC|nr:hypothetical protein RHGRI_021867 [Rhododendron griersonianum]
MVPSALNTHPLASDDDDHVGGRMAIRRQAQVAVTVYPNGAIAILRVPIVAVSCRPHKTLATHRCFRRR